MFDAVEIRCLFIAFEKKSSPLSLIFSSPPNLTFYLKMVKLPFFNSEFASRLKV